MSTLLWDPTFDPVVFTAPAADLLRKLLCKDERARLVNAKDIKQHPFFDSIDWGLLEKGHIHPPWKPARQSVNAMSQESIGEFDYVEQTLTEEEEAVYSDWTYSSRDNIFQEMVELLMWEDRRKVRERLVLNRNPSPPYTHSRTLPMLTITHHTYCCIDYI